MRARAILGAGIAVAGLAMPAEAKIVQEATPICHLAGPFVVEVGQPIILQVWAVKTTPCDRLILKVAKEQAAGAYKVMAIRERDNAKPCIDLYPGATLSTVSFRPDAVGEYTFLADRFDPRAESPETLAEKIKGTQPRSLWQVHVQPPLKK